MVPAVDPRSPDRSYEADDVVRVAVLEVKEQTGRDWGMFIKSVGEEYKVLKRGREF